MWSLEKSAAVLVLVGLIFIGIGAFVTAQAVIITDEQAKQLGTTMWGSNSRFDRKLQRAKPRRSQRPLPDCWRHDFADHRNDYSIQENWLIA
jgi:hypothetical protein